MPVVIFVTPYFTDNAAQFIHALVNLSRPVSVRIISQDIEENLLASVRRKVDRFWKVDDVCVLQTLIEATQGLVSPDEKILRILAVNEQVQVPVAELREKLGVSGMNKKTALNYRDKDRMKTLLEKAGIQVAKHALVKTNRDALKFAKTAGFPMIVKPPAGAATQSTYRITNAEELEALLAGHPASKESPWLLEQFLMGDEHSCDTFMLNGQVMFRTFTSYHPTPLEVVENPWIQWQVILPLETLSNAFDDVRDVADRVLKTLGPVNGHSHMEWFRLKDGSVAVSEIAMRPPGAMFTTLISRCADFDSIMAWANLVIYDEFFIPEQKYTVGVAYLRGMGEGQVLRTEGIEYVDKYYAHMVTDVKIPQPGQAKGKTYEGEGYIVLRSESTKEVEEALKGIVTNVRVLLH